MVQPDLSTFSYKELNKRRQRYGMRGYIAGLLVVAMAIICSANLVYIAIFAFKGQGLRVGSALLAGVAFAILLVSHKVEARSVNETRRIRLHALSARTTR